jgi:hypothetical protein
MEFSRAIRQMLYHQGDQVLSARNRRGILGFYQRAMHAILMTVMDTLTLAAIVSKMYKPA